VFYHFNSNMVRLKDAVRIVEINRTFHFNSNMVRLKARQNIAAHC
jgi:hypothetical protein